LKKSPDQVHRIGLVANFEKASSPAVLRKAAALIARSGRMVAAEEKTADLARLKCARFPDPVTLARETDLLLVFGGDGTMLRVARQIDGTATPILGINVGRLGFLTAVTSTELPQALQKLWRKDFTIETRALIVATGQCGGKSVGMAALNDIVISHGAVSRVIELEVSVDAEPLTRYRGDGLIVSSPTGSTAYSLSAGGPIISPAAEVFAITPICPHALSNRSVIVNLSATVQVKLLTHQVETIVAADGQVQTTLGAQETVTICRSQRAVNLVHLGGHSFFETVRRKLRWSGSPV
jgi:NAD+ kinase